MRKVKSALVVLLASGLGFALFFSMISLVFYFGDWTRLALVFLFGLFVGIVAAPEIEPKIFEKAWSLQLFAGLMTGVTAGWLLNFSTVGMSVSAVIGAFVGWTTPYWIKHVQLP